MVIFDYIGFFYVDLICHSANIIVFFIFQTFIIKKVTYLYYFLYQHCKIDISELKTQLLTTVKTIFQIIKSTKIFIKQKRVLK